MCPAATSGRDYEIANLHSPFSRTQDCRNYGRVFLSIARPTHLIKSLGGRRTGVRLAGNQAVAPCAFEKLLIKREPFSQLKAAKSLIKTAPALVILSAKTRINSHI